MSDKFLLELLDNKGVVEVVNLGSLFKKEGGIEVVVEKVKFPVDLMDNAKALPTTPQL